MLIHVQKADLIVANFYQSQNLRVYSIAAFGINHGNPAETQNWPRFILYDLCFSEPGDCKTTKDAYRSIRPLEM